LRPNAISRSALTCAALAVALFWALGTIAPAAAQGTGMSFSGLEAVRGEPVELRADSLDVDNTTGETLLRGNAVLGQGDMRLAAPVIRIFYDPDASNRILRLEAEGGVTLVTAEEAAEAQDAIYEVVAGTVTMRGDVILTQGPNVLSGDRLTVDLGASRGRMEGNVRTIIQTTP